MLEDRERHYAEALDPHPGTLLGSGRHEPFAHVQNLIEATGSLPEFRGASLVARALELWLYGQTYRDPEKVAIGLEDIRTGLAQMSLQE